MAEARDCEGYPCKPRQVGGGWFYEQKSGIDVFYPLGGGHINIPWCKLIAAVNRHKKVKPIRGRKYK